MFDRDEPTRWICTKCGFVHKGNSAMPKCPVCGHPRDYFEPFTK